MIKQLAKVTGQLLRGCKPLEEGEKILSAKFPPSTTTLPPPPASYVLQGNWSQPHGAYVSEGGLKFPRTLDCLRAHRDPPCLDFLPMFLWCVAGERGGADREAVLTIESLFRSPEENVSTDQVRERRFQRFQEYLNNCCCSGSGIGGLFE